MIVVSLLSCKPRGFNESSDVQKVGLKTPTGEYIEFENVGVEVVIRRAGSPDQKVPTELLKNHLKATLHSSNFEKANSKTKELVKSYERSEQHAQDQLRKEIVRLNQFLEDTKKLGVESALAQKIKIETALQDMKVAGSINTMIDLLVDGLMKGKGLKAVYELKDGAEQNVLFGVLLSYVNGASKDHGRAQTFFEFDINH